MKRRTKHLLLLIILLSLVCAITYGYSAARYVSNSAWNYYLSTKGFYFSSDQLGQTKIVNVNNNWYHDSTYFTIKNNESDSLITDYDIEYTVKCTIQNEAANYSKCTLNGTNSNTFTGVISSSSMCVNNIDDADVSTYTEEQCKSNKYEWVAQKNYKDLFFDIIKTTEQDIGYVSVLIEVTTTSPYSKTILGEFNLSSTEIEKNGLGINYKEYSNYSTLIVTNSYEEQKCVKLNWNASNLRIDETNKNISSFKTDKDGNINEIKFNIDKKDSMLYTFYKTDFSKYYNQQEFNLIESNDC